MLEAMLVDVRGPLVAVLVDAVLHRVAGSPDARCGADVGVFGDAVGGLVVVSVYAINTHDHVWGSDEETEERERGREGRHSRLVGLLLGLC